MIDLIKQFGEKLLSIESRLAELIAVGEVESVQNATVRVKLLDRDNLITGWLPVVTRKTKHDKYLCMPDVGDQVLCLFIPLSDMKRGFVIGALYNQADSIPSETGQDVKRYSDGSKIILNDGELAMHMTNKCMISTGHIQSYSDTIDVDSEMIGVQANDIDVIADNMQVTALNSQVIVNDQGANVTAANVSLTGNGQISLNSNNGQISLNSNQFQVVTGGGGVQLILANDIVLTGNVLINGNVFVNGSLEALSYNGLP